MRIFRLALLTSVLILIGCGFHLRGTQQLKVQVNELSIQPDTPTEFFQHTFRRHLRDIGVAVVSADPKVLSVNLQPEHYVREILVIGTDAEAKQETLIYTISFEIISPEKGSLGLQTIQLERILNIDPDRVLGQNQEETVLIRDMRDEAATQLYYRINMIAQEEPGLSSKPSP